MKKIDPSKKELEKLSKRLTYSPKLVWDAISSAEKRNVFKFGKEYKRFLDQAKTEREASFLSARWQRREDFTKT